MTPPHSPEPPVDAETWLRVQTNVDANNARGERPQKYDHSLKGTLYYACGAKLMIERSATSPGTATSTSPAPDDAAKPPTAPAQRSSPNAPKPRPNASS